MKKKSITMLLFLLLFAFLVIAIPALAANELVFNGDTLIDLSDPDINLTILNNSRVDSMTANSDSIDFTMSTNGILTVRSTDRKANYPA